MNTFLDYASAKYYAGEPIISDEEFDKLAEYYDYTSVGAVVIGNSVPHAFSMWSLQKVYTDEPLINYTSKSIWSAKLDGAAVAHTYVYGRHIRSLTRGDGKEGHIITDNMATLIPTYCSGFSKIPLIQVTGEVVAPSYIDNARNYAAGALGLKDVQEFKTRDISFIAYGVLSYQHDCWSNDMEMLQELGFKTVLTSDISAFPTDGKVCRIDNYSAFEAEGYTSKHPRGAFALKERTGGIITKLLNVEWQVGRSGVVSPVAILEPIVIGGALVSRATLHNIKYIRELDLDIGCLVEVIRAGEIIPKVIRRIYE
jgi:NAD-dependent DNA ligase